MSDAPVIFACDPGANGALAVLRGDDLLTVEDMPILRVRVGGNLRSRVDETLLADLIQKLIAAHVGPLDEVRFVIEHVGPMPRDGSQQAFGLGYAFGVVRGAMSVHRFPLVLVRPAEWKKALKLKRDKDESRQLAIRTWPRSSASFARVKDDGRAEAALIGLWQARHGA